MKKEKTTPEKIQFLKDWIERNGATEKTTKLLDGLERERVLYLHLVPHELTEELFGSNVGPMSREDLAWLKETFYHGRFTFKWPSTEVRP